MNLRQIGQADLLYSNESRRPISGTTDGGVGVLESGSNKISDQDGDGIADLGIDDVQCQFQQNPFNGVAGYDFREAIGRGKDGEALLKKNTTWADG